MFSALVVQRHAVHLCRTKSVVVYSINDLSLRAFHGRPNASHFAAIGRGRLYATVPDAATNPIPQPAGMPPPESKKKAKVELRPSPKLPEVSGASTSSILTQPVPSTAPSATTATTAASTAAVDAAPQPLPIPPSTAEVPQAKGLRSSLDQAIADVLKATREGEIAPIDPTLPWLRRMFRWGLELGKFYWRGIKRINEHRKIVAEIKRRCKEEGREMTWREVRFRQLYRRDAIKLLPFVLTLLILEEAIPVVVIWAPFLLPSTCILKSQQERMEATRLAKQRAAVAQLGSVLNGDSGSAASGAEKATSVMQQLKEGQRLQPEVVKSLCGLLGISTYFPTPFLRSRLQSRLSQLEKDDALLQPALPGLDIHELREAVTERGGLAVGAPESELRTWLSRWLKAANKPAEDGKEDAREARRIELMLEYALKQWESKA